IHRLWSVYWSCPSRLCQSHGFSREHKGRTRLQFPSTWLFEQTDGTKRCVGNYRMIGMRRVVKSLLPDSLHAPPLRIEDGLWSARAGLIAWRGPQDQITKTVKENLRRAVRKQDSSLPALGDRWQGYGRELRRRLPTLRGTKTLIEYAQSSMA